LSLTSVKLVDIPRWRVYPLHLDVDSHVPLAELLTQKARLLVPDIERDSVG